MLVGAGQSPMMQLGKPGMPLFPELSGQPRVNDAVHLPSMVLPPQPCQPCQPAHQHRMSAWEQALAPEPVIFPPQPPPRVIVRQLPPVYAPSQQKHSSQNGKARIVFQPEFKKIYTKTPDCEDCRREEARGLGPSAPPGHCVSSDPAANFQMKKQWSKEMEREGRCFDWTVDCCDCCDDCLTGEEIEARYPVRKRGAIDPLQY